MSWAPLMDIWSLASLRLLVKPQEVSDALTLILLSSGHDFSHRTDESPPWHAFLGFEG